MKLITFSPAYALTLALFTFASTAAAVPQAPAGEGVPVRITVTAVSREKGQQPPNLSKADFLIYQNHKRRAVLDVVREAGENNKLDLYILIDEAIQTDVTLDYREIGNFVHELPSTARVGVLYGLNGTVKIPQDLSENRDAAIKALRIPLGRIGAGGGIFLSVGDVAKRIPQSPDRRSVILFLSSGIDLFRGVTDSYAGVNPDLQVAIDRLNRSGITVYPIYVAPAAHFGRNLFLVTNGQSCLARLAAETGGEAFFEGFITPITMKPFLEEIAEHLNNQYLVTFAAAPGHKSGYEPIHVSTELSGVEITGPTGVYVPVPK